MRGIIYGTQGMCHGMSDTEPYVGEALTGNVLTQSHAFAAFLSISYRATQDLEMISMAFRWNISVISQAALVV